MRFDTAKLANFTNREIAFRWYGRKRILQLNQYAIDKSSEFTLSLNLAQRVTLIFYNVLLSNTLHKYLQRTLGWNQFKKD